MMADKQKPRTASNNAKTRAKSPTPIPIPTHEPENVEPSKMQTEPRPINGNGAGQRKSQNRRNSLSERNNVANGQSPQRRNSWISNMTSKFSSSNQAGESPPQKMGASPPGKTLLSHGAKVDGQEPYTPAPPRGQQGGILSGMIRRLSSSSGVRFSEGRGENGIVERRTLNVNPERARCPIADLKQSSLQKVSFLPDVEIRTIEKFGSFEVEDKTQKRRMVEKGEGEALKNPQALTQQKETDGVIKSTGEAVPKAPKTEGTEGSDVKTDGSEGSGATTPSQMSAADQEKVNKKKEKKKRSEEERKARKEKKRRLAEANGSVPVEIRCDSSDSSRPSTPNSVSTYRPANFSSTGPVRVYRRCCQLRETPILKKITEQLSDASNFLSETGVVDKLDLTGYWLQLDDMRTLADFLAVVPVREVYMENCSITDEGLRCILAGLLAAKRPNLRHKRAVFYKTGHGGVVETLVLKNNKLGFMGWKHVCLFMYLCRSLKTLDLCNIAFPQKSPVDMASMFSQCVSERLAGPTLHLLNLSGTHPNAQQTGLIIDGIIKLGLKRLGFANNELDASGVGEVARYLAAKKCEGLDLGGNDLVDHLGTVAAALEGDESLLALCLANCNLRTSSLQEVMPVLVRSRLRFLDLSHNHDLFRGEPSVTGLLRK